MSKCKSSKKVIVALSGSIACVKGLSLCLSLRHRDISVRVAMTNSACQFVNPLTLTAVSDAQVYSHIWENQKSFPGELHMEWAEWADLIVIAPCTASLIASLSLGFYDSPVSLLAGNINPSKWLIAPAMSQNMWEQPAVQENVARIKSWGATFLWPVSGTVASGGQGQRMLEPREISEKIDLFFTSKGRE